MPCCRDVTRLLSEDLDENLTGWQRFQLGLHLLLCRYCARFARQLRFLTEALRAHLAGCPPAGPPLPATLSEEARQRIREALEAGDA